MDLFVSCAPGLEPLLADEIRGRNLGKPVEIPGGVEMKGGLRSIYRANLELGLAQQVRARLGTFLATNAGELGKKTARLEFERWVDPKRPLRVSVTTRRSRLAHSGEIVDRVRRAIAHRVKGAPEDGRNGAHVHVRIVDDRVQISLDTSGAPLHRRGYRLDPGPAPLREDLARAIVMVSGWDCAGRLVDPLVGSGTIAIEAALLASGRPPGDRRSFEFEQAPCFDSALWARTKAAARRPARSVEVFGSDRDAAAVFRAAANAERAGVKLELDQASLSEAQGLRQPPAKGALVTNPPWGGRLSGDASALYRRLSELVTQLPPAWAAGVVFPAEVSASRAWRSVLLTDARGTKVRFCRRGG